MSRATPAAALAAALLLAVAARGQDPPQLARYVDQALAANPALERSALEVEIAGDLVAEARALRHPSLDLSARHSRADGGRAIELPIGDLVNPITATLDELLVAGGRDPRFEPLDNVAVPFLRGREQDTRLRLSQPLLQPGLRANLRARLADLDATRSGHRVAATDLVRDVRVAYWRVCQAGAVTEVLAATAELVSESLGIAESRFARGVVTEDEVFRERAELADVAQRRLEAERQRDAAVRRLNELAGRPLAAPFDAAGCALAAGAITDAADTDTDLGARGGARSELDEIDGLVRASSAGVDAAAAERHPALALAVDLGAQGERYDLDEGYWQASLLLSWNLADFGRREARRSAARRRVEQLENLRRDVERRILLEVRDAEDQLAVAREAVRAGARRVAAAEEAYRIVERRQRAGRVPQVALTDARRELTAARVAARLASYEVRLRLAELERARGADDPRLPSRAAAVDARRGGATPAEPAPPHPESSEIASPRPRPESPGLEKSGLEKPELEKPGFEKPGLEKPGFETPWFETPEFEDDHLASSDADTGELQP